MKDNPGYSTGRTAAGNTVVIGNGNGPIGVSSTRALRDPESQCGDKMSGGTVTRSSQGYGIPGPLTEWCSLCGNDRYYWPALKGPGIWFYSSVEPKAPSIRRQASSSKQQASSLKPQASSSKILEPRKSFTDLEPRCWTMINVLCGCLI